VSEIPLSTGEQRALYRRLISHPQWLAQVGRYGAFHLRSPQNAWVTLFSSKADLALAQAQSPEPIQTVAMSGFEPFALHLSGPVGLAIDPASPGAIHFKDYQLEHLEEWGRGAWVESLLRHGRQDPWIAGPVIEFSSYLVPVTGQGAETRYMDGQDSFGRSGMALFAVEDALHRYLDQQSKELLETVRILKFSGRKLFRSLSSSGTPRQVVLNPAGPGPALHIGALKFENWLKAGSGERAV
jgi:hypothetical protein